MQEVTDILKQSIQYSLDHRPEAVEYALQFGRDLDRDWPTSSSACTSTTGRWITARGAAKRSRAAEGRRQSGLVPDAGEIEYVTAR